MNLQIPDTGVLENAFDFLGENITIIVELSVLIGVVIWVVNKVRRVVNCEKDEVIEKVIKHCDGKFNEHEKKVNSRFEATEKAQKNTDEAQDKILEDLKKYDEEFKKDLKAVDEKANNNNTKLANLEGRIGKCENGGRKRK